MALSIPVLLGLTSSFLPSMVNGKITTSNNAVIDTDVFRDTFQSGLSNDWEFMQRPINKFGSRIDEYRRENVQVDDGYCYIHTEHDQVNGTFTQGYMRNTRSGFRYGTVEWRAKLAAGRGIHSVLRVFSNNAQQLALTFAFNGEAKNGLVTSLDYSRPGNGTDGITTESSVVLSKDGEMAEVNYARDFHVFKIVWKPEEILWLVDGTVVYQVTELASLFRDLMFVVMFSQADNTVDETTPAETAMVIDHVTVHPWK